MNSYIPQAGHRVIVDFEESGPQAETISEVAEDGSWVLLSQGMFSDWRATIDTEGQWRLQESGHPVFLLDPQAGPERGGTGFVITADGTVEEWSMDAECEPGVAEGFHHKKQVVGMAQQQHDGTWVMNETEPIFFISAAQEAQRD